MTCALDGRAGGDGMNRGWHGGTEDETVMKGRTVILIALVMSATAALAGCRSGPAPRYYTLDLRPSGSARPARCALRVDRLDAVEPLSRDGILIQMSPTEAEYYASDRWLAPAEGLVAEKLAAEFGTAEGKPVILLAGTLRALEQVDFPGGAEAHLKLDAALRRPPMSRYEEPLLRKTYEARVPAEEPRPAAVVRALSKAVEAVAAEIAADADRLAGAGG